MNEETVIDKSELKKRIEKEHGSFDRPVKVTVDRAGVHVDLKSALTHPRMRYYLELMKTQNLQNKGRG